MPINPAVLERLAAMRRMAEARNPAFAFGAHPGSQDEFSPDARYMYQPRGGNDQMSEEVAFRGGVPHPLEHEAFFSLVRGDSSLPPTSDDAARQIYLRAMSENQPPGVRFGASVSPPTVPGARVSPNPAFGQTQYSARYQDPSVPPQIMSPEEATATAEGRHMWLEPMDLTYEMGLERAKDEAARSQAGLDPRIQEARARGEQGVSGRLASFLERLFQR